MNIYTFGYGNRGKEQARRLVKKILAENLLLVDVRISPRGWASFWSKYTLEKALPDNYFWCQKWGNTGTKENMVVDMWGGLAALPSQGRDCVLLCAELNPGTLEKPNCHRLLIADHWDDPDDRLTGIHNMGELEI